MAIAGSVATAGYSGYSWLQAWLQLADARSALLALLWCICGSGYSFFVSTSPQFFGKEVKLQGAPSPNPREKTPAWLQPSCSHQMPPTRPHAALWQGWLRWLQVDTARPCSQRASTPTTARADSKAKEGPCRHAGCAVPEKQPDHLWV